MAYEALNNAASLKSNFIIVLNDNEMSITENVGGMSSYLSGLRTASAYTDFKMDVTKALNRIPGIGPGMVDAMRKTKSSIKQIIIPGMLFEDMGTYVFRSCGRPQHSAADQDLPGANGLKDRSGACPDTEGPRL